MLTTDSFILTPEQQDQILTDEIVKRTADERVEYLASRPGKAYFAVNGGVNKWWPVRLGMDIAIVLFMMFVGFLIHPLLGLILLFVVPWYMRKNTPSMTIVTVGERGNLTIDHLFWYHAYKMDQYIQAGTN